MHMFIQCPYMVIIIKRNPLDYHLKMLKIRYIEQNNKSQFFKTNKFSLDNHRIMKASYIRSSRIKHEKKSTFIILITCKLLQSFIKLYSDVYSSFNILNQHAARVTWSITVAREYTPVPEVKTTNHQTLPGYAECQEHRCSHCNALHHSKLECNMEE